MTLGNYIKQYRTEHQMGTREFARRCGISRGYIGHLERGINTSTGLPPIPSRATVQKVAAATCIDFDELVSLLSEDGETPFVDRPSIRRPTQRGKQQILEFFQRPVKKIIAIGNKQNPLPDPATEPEILSWKFDPMAQNLFIHYPVFDVFETGYIPPAQEEPLESTATLSDIIIEESAEMYPTPDKEAPPVLQRQDNPEHIAGKEVFLLSPSRQDLSHDEKDRLPSKTHSEAEELKDDAPLEPPVHTVVVAPLVDPALWSSIQMDIQSAVAAVAHKYSITLECHPGISNSSGNILFHLEAKPDLAKKTLQKQLFSLPLEVYHEKDIEWCTQYLEEMLDFPAKEAWDSVCALMGLTRDDFGREITFPDGRVGRIVGADPALLRIGKTKRILVWLRDIQSGDRIILDIRDLKVLMSEFKHFPYSRTDSSQFFEYGEWLYWLTRVKNHFTDKASGLTLLPEDHHRIIRLGMTYYEICGVATLARENTIILRNLQRGTLKKVTPRSVLIALGRITENERNNQNDENN